MKFLGQKPTREFVRFVKEYESALHLRITFLTMDSHPIDHYKRNVLGTFVLDKTKGLLIVYVNTRIIKDDNLPPISKEIIAAHEILHPWADSIGFPVTQHSEKYSEDGPEASAGSSLHSLIQHVPIDARLRESGFDPFIVLRPKGLELLKRWETTELSNLDKADYKFFSESTFYIESQIRYPDDIAEAIKQHLEQRNVEIFRIGERGLAIIRESGCHEPEGALAALIQLRDLFNLKEHGVFMFSPIHNKVY